MSDDEDEFFDAHSRTNMSRQSSLGSSLPSPKQSQPASSSDRGALLNTCRAEPAPLKMGDKGSESSSQTGAVKPIPASAKPDATSKQEQQALLSLDDDASVDPLESGTQLNVSRLNEAAPNAAGLPSTSADEPLSSPLLQASAEPSLSAAPAADPFAQVSPEPVLSSEAESAWATPSAMHDLTADSSPESGASQGDKQHNDRRNGSVELDVGGDIKATTALEGAGRRPSPVRSLSNTLDDISADQSGGLFGGLEMEDVDEPPEKASGAGANTDTPAVSSSSSTAAAAVQASKASGEAARQETRPGAAANGGLQPAIAKVDVVQPLPLSKPASDGRGEGSVAISEASFEPSAKAAVDSASAGPSASGAGPSMAIIAADSRDDGAALQDFVSLLSRKKRHYFMISNGGIPVFSRHGRTHDTASISALLYSIVSLSLDALGEIPHTFTAGELTVCVRARRVRPDPYAPQRPGHHPRHPYTLAPAAHRSLGNVAVLTASATRSDLPAAVLHVQLELLHLQLLAWTSAKYERVLMHNPAMDTSAALAGTAPSFEALIKRMDFAMDYVLQAVETLRMRPIVRGAADAALQQAVVDSDGVWGVIACGHQVVAVTSHPQLPVAQHLHAWDLLLLLNLVTANSSYRSSLAGQQAWLPLCLPKSAPDCFHFVYVHYPSADSPLFIALIGRSQQKFFETHSVREPLMDTLASTGVLQEAKIAADAPSCHRAPPAAIPFQDRLRHLQPLLYHMTVARCNMFVQTAFAPALGDHAVQKQARQDCMRLHASMWGAASVSKTHDPMPIQWRACSRWALIGVIERGEFEAYAVLDPLIHKTEAMALFNHALAYLLENPENWQASALARVSEGSSFWGTTSADGSRSRAVLRS
eukprot:jgi/Ulvmu1/7000/UM033_0058.1